MTAEDLRVDNGRNRQPIESVGKGLVDFHRVSALAFIEKPVIHIDIGTFVIAAQQEEILGMSHFIGKQETDRLQRLVATVDVVA